MPEILEAMLSTEQGNAFHYPSGKDPEWVKDAKLELDEYLQTRIPLEEGKIDDVQNLVNTYATRCMLEGFQNGFRTALKLLQELALPSPAPPPAESD